MTWAHMEVHPLPAHPSSSPLLPFCFTVMSITGVGSHTHTFGRSITGVGSHTHTPLAGLCLEWASTLTHLLQVVGLLPEHPADPQQQLAGQAQQGRVAGSILGRQALLDLKEGSSTGRRGNRGSVIRRARWMLDEGLSASSTGSTGRCGQQEREVSEASVAGCRKS